MNILIVEDEVPAAEKLERYLQKYDPTYSIIGKLASIQETTEFLRTNLERIDLIFMDIQLIDGLSFQIFQQIDIKKPVIFTTAFNEYALDAFKVNSIDYLLKPITFTDLANSLKKFQSLRDQFQLTREQQAVLRDSTVFKKNYKNRFMVKLGEHIRSVTTDNILLFYAEGRDVFLITSQMRKFIIDYTLEALEEMLDPTTFFRLNRTFIININAIKDVVVYSNSRLRILLNNDFDKEIVVSRERVNDFKKWFDGTHEG
jgi:two-component system, LytTR family, response regulator